MESRSQQPCGDAPPPSSEATLAYLCQALAAVSRKPDQLHEFFAQQRKDNYVVEEVAKLTGRSEYTVRRWIGEGRIKAIRLAEGGPRGRLLIPRSELDRLVAAGMGGGIPDSAVG